MEESTNRGVEETRAKLREVLRDVNELVAGIERDGLPDGTHALASALRQRLDDLIGAIDGVLDPNMFGTRPMRGGRNAAASPVDETVLSHLLEDLGDPSRVSYLVQLFLTEMHGRRIALTVAAEQNDGPAAKAVAHTLKSSALLLGAAPLGRACDALSDNDEPERLRPLVEDVLQHATAAARWFQIWLSNQHVAPTPIEPDAESPAAS